MSVMYKCCIFVLTVIIKPNSVMEFKGTKGEWLVNGIDIYSLDSSGIIAQVFDGLDTHVSEMKEPIQKANAEVIVEAGNVRQQIDYSLTELLEKYNEAMKSLKKLTSESLKTKQHHNLPSFKKAIDEAELLIKKQ